MDSIEYANRRQWQREAEAEGRVADSMKVRLELMERVHKGEISLQEAQAQLSRIKAGAKRKGQITRNQAFRGR